MILDFNEKGFPKFKQARLKLQDREGASEQRRDQERKTEKEKHTYEVVGFRVRVGLRVGFRVRFRAGFRVRLRVRG